MERKLVVRLPKTIDGEMVRKNLEKEIDFLGLGMEGKIKEGDGGRILIESYQSEKQKILII